MSGQGRPGRAVVRAVLLLGVAGSAGAAPIELLHHGPQPSVVGQGIVVSTRIDAVGLPQPTGTITIGDGVDFCTAQLPQGSCLWTPRTPGVRTLTVSYPGDGNFLASMDSEPHVVEPHPLPQRLSLGPTLLSYDLSGAAAFGGGPRSTALSADGRFVAFITAFALDPIDTGFGYDAYLLDRHSGNFTLVSADPGGLSGNQTTDEVAITPDGRYVAFSSLASNLVAGDTNGVRDVFLRDIALGTTVRVNLNQAGTQAGLDSHEPDVSADGRRIAFKSLANLVPSDTNTAGTHADVYVRDLDLGVTLLVSVNTSGDSSAGHSYSPFISDDGDKVAFLSAVADLVVSDGNGATVDAFVRDIGSGNTEVVSLDGTGGQRPSPVDQASITPDGGKVLFRTPEALAAPDAGFIADCYVRDLVADTTTLVSARDDDTGGSTLAQVENCAIGDGTRYWFISMASDLVAGADEPSSADVFLRDIAAATTVRVTAGDAHGALTVKLAGSSDGRFVAFDYNGGRAVPGVDSDIAIYDDADGSFAGVKLDRRGNQADTEIPPGALGNASVSADGRYVAFVTNSRNLVPNQIGTRYDVVVRDRVDQSTETISAGPNDTPADGDSFAPSLSADGRYVAFVSNAGNLVPGDGGGWQDVFVYDRDFDTMQRVSVDPSGVDGDNHSHQPAISADGRYVVFHSQAGNLVAGDGNSRTDVFRWDRQQPPTSAIERVSVSSSEVEGNLDSSFGGMSADGARIVFQSDSTNFGPGGPGTQVFLRQVDAGTTQQLSVAPGNTAPDGSALQPVISASGRYVAFWTTSTNFATAQPGANRLLRLDLDDGSFAAVLDTGGVPIPVASDQYANLSDDGRYLALATAFQLDPGDLDGAIDANVYDFDNDSGRVVLGAGGVEPQIQPSRHSLALSGAGDFVTARAAAANLVTADTNAVADQFLFENPAFDLQLEQQVETLSANAADASLAPASDASGRYIVFQSAAENLAPGDSNGASDIFRVDTDTGATVRLSLNDDGSPLGADSLEPSVSADGGAVLFVSADSGITKLFGETTKKTQARAKGAGWSVLLRNLVTGTTQRLAAAQPGGSGTQPRIAPAAAAIVYSAPNPDPLLGVPGQAEVFHLPLQRVGANLVPGTPRCVSCKAVDANGQDTPQNSNGPSRAPSLSANGEWVAWQSEASNPLPAAPPPCPNVSTVVLLRNLITGAAQRISVPAPSGGCGANGSGASQPGLDWAGRTMVFTTDQPLLPDDDNGFSDAYAFDLDRQRLLRVSQTSAGSDGNGDTTGATISGDGSQVAFVSAATNLDGVDPDTNGFRDTHVATLTGGTLTGGARAVRRLSRTRAGAEANGHSQRPALNYNGTRLAFDSDSGNLAPGAQAGVLNVFQRANPLNGDTVFAVGFE